VSLLIQADGAALVEAQAMEQAEPEGRSNSTSLLASISGYIAKLQQELEEKRKVGAGDAL
jgi:hypothetical protein